VQVLDTLRKQRGQIEKTGETLGRAEGSVDRSRGILKDMEKWSEISFCRVDV
jgi:hypothetical protein